MEIDPDGLAEGMAKLIASLAIEYLDNFKDAGEQESAFIHFEELSVSAEKCLEVAQYAFRDILRISTDQQDEFSRQKYAAYHAFWFSKLKPLSNVFRRSAKDTEIVDINERFAISLMAYLLDLSSVTLDAKNSEEYSKATGFEKQPMPLVWELCTQNCDRQCFRNHLKTYMSFRNSQNFDYLVHSMRRRATGPYDLVNVLETLVHAACTDPKLSQR